VCDLLPFPSPSLTQEISTIRQVPDHQEVYLDKDGFTSIIFDITERVGLPGTGPAVDGAALTTHLEDIVASDIDTVKVWNTSNTQFSKLPYAFLPPPPTSLLPISIQVKITC
jgi:Ran-interacting Mog1 protein